VTRIRHILNMRRVDRDTARLLFWRLINVRVIHERRAAGFRQHFRDRCRQRRLTMVNVTNRADVAMRLRTLELFLTHVLRFPTVCDRSGSLMTIALRKPATGTLNQLFGPTNCADLLERVKGIEPS
jgi:hypothetical protein